MYQSNFMCIYHTSCSYDNLAAFLRLEAMWIIMYVYVYLRMTTTFVFKNPIASKSALVHVNVTWPELVKTGPR